MSEDQPISLKDFGASFMGFLQQAAAQAPVEEPIFVRLLRTHFGAELTTLPVVAEAFELSDHPNLHLAIEAYLAQEGRSAELLGIIGGFPYVDFSLSQLIAPAASGSARAISSHSGTRSIHEHQGG